jgi:integral membrane protein
MPEMIIEKLISNKNKKLMKKSLNTLRLLALLEGISFLVLLGIAMPLKYYLDKPDAVKIVGMAHGVLFVLYTINLLIVHIKLKWSLGVTFGAFIASFIPFGTFYADKKWFRS